MNLHITPSVPPEDPVVEGSPELLLMAGTSHNLTCVTRGAKPAAHIQWTKNGLPAEGAYHSTVTHTHPCTHADNSSHTCVCVCVFFFPRGVCKAHIMMILMIMSSLVAVRLCNTNCRTMQSL